MPIFEYVCRDCQHPFEAIVSASRQAKCPECQQCVGPLCVPDFSMDSRPCSVGVCLRGKCEPLKVTVTGLDVTTDFVGVQLSPVGVQGTLTLELSGPDHHVISRSTKVGGFHRLSFEIQSLAAGEYTEVRATWDVNGVQSEGARPYHIRVLGTYRHSQYNIPREALCSGGPTPAFVTTNSCQFTATTLRSQFASQVNLNGSGVAMAHGNISREFVCQAQPSAPPGANGASFRLGASFTGTCGPLANGTVAVLPSHPYLKCGDRIFIHTQGVKEITDLCPGCAVEQLDNFTTDGRCSGISDLGQFMTIQIIR